MSNWTNFISTFSSSAGNLPGTAGTIGGIANGALSGFAEGGPAGALAGGLQSGLSSILSLIGRGRKEADIIVPVQNQLGEFLAAVNSQMLNPDITVRELDALYQAVIDAYTQFDAYTRDPRFTDGRASRQARNTIRPLIDGKDDDGNIVRSDGGTLGNIERLIIDRGGIPPGNVANGGAPGQPPAVVPGSVPPQRGNGLLIAGGVAIGAKLLGWF